MNVELKAGELTLVAGASGAGKSTFLRLVAGLEPIVGTAHHPEGSIQLHVQEDKSPKTYDSQRDRNLWRQQVRYVTQFKVDLPGTPREFIQSLMAFQIAKRHSLNTTTKTMVTEVKKLMQAWGMDPNANSLESDDNEERYNFHELPCNLFNTGIEIFTYRDVADTVCLYRRARPWGTADRFHENRLRVFE